MNLPKALIKREEIRNIICMLTHIHMQKTLFKRLLDLQINITVLNKAIQKNIYWNYVEIKINSSTYSKLFKDKSNNRLQYLKLYNKNKLFYLNYTFKIRQ